MLNKTALCYSAGSLAALLMCLAMHFIGAAGLHARIGVAMNPALTLSWLFPHLVWGGIVGMFFALPLPFRFSWLGLFAITVVLTCFQLFVVFPLWEGMGYLGLRFGYAMPLVCFFYTLLYTVGTSVSLKIFGGR